jgi:ribonuclease/clavin/mitogillin
VLGKQREEQIISVLISKLPDKRIWTSMEIVKVIYVGYPEEVFQAAEKGVIQHLQKLLNEGRVLKRENGWEIIMKGTL